METVPMKHMDWNTFETLLDAVAGKYSETLESDTTMHTDLLQISKKKQQLDQHLEQFKIASEETILDRYVQMKQSHQDLLSALRSVQHASIAPSKQR
jgi:acetyl-CoA carboxylase carboxyltransferase component